MKNYYLIFILGLFVAYFGMLTSRQHEKNETTHNKTTSELKDILPIVIEIKNIDVSGNIHF